MLIAIVPSKTMYKIKLFFIMVRKKAIWISALLFVAGILLGVLIGNSDFPGAGLEGNISKAKRFKSAVISEHSQLISEKLISDAQFAQQTLSSLALISSRAGEFSVNASIAAVASSEIEPLKELSLSMENLKNVSKNASLNASLALTAVQGALKGEVVDMEQTLNNALVSYLLLNRYIPVAKSWVEGVDTFMKGKKVADYKMLAFAKKQWTNYVAFESLLDGDEKEYQYWANIQTLLTADELADCLNALDNTEKAILGAALMVYSGLSDKYALSPLAQTAATVISYNQAMYNSDSYLSVQANPQGGKTYVPIRNAEADLMMSMQSSVANLSQQSTLGMLLSLPEDQLGIVFNTLTESGAITNVTKEELLKVIRANDSEQFFNMIEVGELKNQTDASTLRVRNQDFVLANEVAQAVLKCARLTQNLQQTAKESINNISPAELKELMQSASASISNAVQCDVLGQIAKGKLNNDAQVLSAIFYDKNHDFYNAQSVIFNTMMANQSSQSIKHVLNSDRSISNQVVDQLSSTLNWGNIQD